VTRYASRIVETKSGQIRGILQVCVSILLAREGGDGEEKQDEKEENDAGCGGGRPGGEGYRTMNHPRQDLGIPAGGTDT